jgi:hypothetical protein
VSEHVEQDAAILVTLPSDDPERLRAETHAAACPSCRLVLDGAEALARRVARALETAPPPRDRLRRAAVLVEAEMRRERRTERVLAALVAAGVISSWLFQIALDHSTASTDPPRVVVSLSILAVAVAAVLVSKNRRRLALAALVATSGLLAQAAGSVAAFEPKIGFQCTLWEVVSAAIPWTVAAAVSRRWNAGFSRADMMTIAAGGALASQAAQHLTCPVWHADAHLLVFHVGGVVLAVGLGALGPRARTNLAGA